MSDKLKPERAAVLYLPFDLLAKLLHLPAGARIDLVESDIFKNEVVWLRVNGAGWPVWSGSQLQVTASTITEYLDEDGRCFKRVITWDLPTEAT